MKKLALIFLALLITLSGMFTTGSTSVSANSSTSSSATTSTFSWDNATVYFAITDRFLDGDSSNNHSYGRELDQNGNPYPDYKSKVGTFHGGDLKGLTQKIDDGYFNNLGVNAIWITAPYEQIHGWVGGEAFRHYAYHGYYALDFTEVDQNMGTEADFRTFVDTAHANGIRVVMDIVMNHAGYETMKDMNEFNFGQLSSGWQNYYYNQPESAAHYNTYANYVETTNASRWQNWWGSDWVRLDKPGYTACGNSDQQMCLSGLPDFKTDSASSVGLPPILINKWSAAKRTQEQAELDAFFNRTGKPRTVTNYLTKWLTDWVREYGVDGFRVDTAKHVDLSAWKGLKEEAVIALREWKAANPAKKLDDLDFWMTGEVWGHGVGRSNYFDNGFDSVINFSFQSGAGNLATLPGIHAEYASKINADSSFNVLTYISSHDTSLYNRANLINGGTSLLLLPGAVQIYYGDESARQPMVAPWDQPTRSDMNWNSMDQAVLSHWQKLGQFRNNHISIGAGDHQQIQASPYTFSRTYNKNGMQDKVVVVIGASGSTAVNAGSVFPDGTLVKDFYTGSEGVVQNGRVTIAAHANGVILLEEIPTPEVKVSASPAGGSFSKDGVEVTLSVQNAATGKYTLDGSDPATAGISFTNGQKLTIGQGLQIGDSVTLKLYGINDLGIDAREYTFTKTERSLLTIHFKKPASWGSPQLYYYETTPKLTGPTWATAPVMVAEGNGWFTYTIEDAESARIIFKDANGNQLPGAQQAGLLVTEESWYDNGWIANPTDNQPPTVPSNLRTVAKTQSTIQLAWDASTDNVAVTGYEVYRDGVKAGTTATASYSDSGLNADTLYQYTVRAYDAAGNVSAESAQLSASTEPRDVVAPSQPTNLTASSVTHHSVSLTWSAATDNVAVVGYEIYRDNSKVGSSAQTSYADSGLTANTAYSYSVKAYDAEGNLSAASPALEVTTNELPPTNTATIYYKRGYSTPYFHYAPTGGAWTTAPGKAMTASSEYAGYSVITVDLGSATSMQAVFNNGSGTWDNNGGKNYTFPAGVSTFDNGKITSGAPNTTPQPGNEATIYYKRGYAAPYLHYAPSGAAWTTSPGVKMEDSEIAGYSKLTVNLGTATSMQAVFNNGSGAWDNNGGRNYTFPAGVSTFNNGTITSGAPTTAVQEGLTIRLTVPGNTPANESIYIATNISGWNPSDNSNKLTRNEDGTYSITLPIASGTKLEFKFTRGTWNNVEVNASGSDLSNRTYTMNSSSQQLDLTVQKWKDK